ncbi:MAG TPA: malate synthase A, partial [Micromonosporaceae bacterium]|nr:malate synthase A [Micromonosporaceae bacterium]
AADGFDGSWVAHPDLVPVCQEVFDAALGDRPNQLDRRRDPAVVPGSRAVSADELLNIAATPGAVTEAGVRNNVSVALQYIEAWLGGNGAVAINNLMEDAATAEISRSQVWQWIHNGVRTDAGVAVTAELVRRIEDEELAKLGDAQRFAAARALFDQVALGDDFVDFLTLPAYQLID